MGWYKIENLNSGEDLGVWEGKTEDDAEDAMNLARHWPPEDMDEDLDTLLITEMTDYEVKYIETIQPNEVTAEDLRAEVAEAMLCGELVECARVTLRKRGDPEEAQEAQTATVVFFDSTGRAGVADGADATWIDAESCEDAAHKVLELGLVDGE